jgi:flagellar assembly protein FliH
VKKSLSKLIREKDPSFYNIHTFEAEAVSLNNTGLLSEGISEPEEFSEERDSLAYSWEPPVVDRTCEEPVKKKEDFKTRLARIEKEAYEKGFEQGQRDGFALEESKIEEMGKQLDAIFTGLLELKPQIYAESERELLKLAMLIAKKVIGEEVRTNSAIIGNSIRSALKFLTDKRKIRIIIHPEDMEEARRLLPDLAKQTKGGHLQLTEDNSIARGGCILETGFGSINATIEDQLDLIEETIEREYRSGDGRSP